MTLTLDLSSGAEAQFPQEQLAKLTAIYEQQFPTLQTREYVIEVDLVSAENIQIINRDQRQKDKPTDVLSFPLFPNQQTWESFQSPEILLGSIIIAPECVAPGSSLLDMLHHGILHILGYDHETNLLAWRTQEHAIIDQAHQHSLVLEGIPDTV